MSRQWLIAAAIAGFLGVAAGAFGTHSLRSSLEGSGRLGTYETAVQYLLVHAAALLGTAWASERYPGPWSRWAGGLFCAGLVLFCGSLFILALFDLRFWGAVAPFGGAMLLAGWAALGIAAWRGPSDA